MYHSPTHFATTNRLTHAAIYVRIHSCYVHVHVCSFTPDVLRNQCHSCRKTKADVNVATYVKSTSPSLLTSRMRMSLSRESELSGMLACCNIHTHSRCCQHLHTAVSRGAFSSCCHEIAVKRTYQHALAKLFTRKTLTVVHVQRREQV